MFGVVLQGFKIFNIWRGESCNGVWVSAHDKARDHSHLGRNSEERRTLACLFFLWHAHRFVGRSLLTILRLQSSNEYVTRFILFFHRGTMCTVAGFAGRPSRMLR